MERARKKMAKPAGDPKLSADDKTAEASKAPIAKRRGAVKSKSIEAKNSESIQSPDEKTDPSASMASAKPGKGRSKVAASKSAGSKTPAVKTKPGKTIASKPAASKGTPGKAGATKAATKTATAKPALKRAAKPAVSRPAAAKIEPLASDAEIKLGFLADFVGFHLRLAQDASYRAFSRHRDKDLIKPGRLPALAIIHLNPGISQSALGRAIARDKSTVSPLIKDLQKNGFINRKASTQDRRSVTLALTKKGERTLDRLQARAQEHENEIDRIIGPSKSRLLTMLDKITTGMAP